MIYDAMTATENTENETRDTKQAFGGTISKDSGEQYFNPDKFSALDISGS